MINIYGFRMAWRCQVEPYLKSISSKVTKCESASYKLKNKKVQGFNVHIEETVFFPEGGGQPGDAGIIKSDNTTVSICGRKNLLSLGY